MEEITFGSLFAGIGGFDLGFERVGMKCKWQVEIDDYATQVLAKHWPNVHRERDIRQCGKHNLEPVDVICGGFPCQDISYAGSGAGLDGERSGLFFESVRLVRELRPRVVVLENVSALLTRGLDRVLGTLASLGFDAEWHCIPASHVGAPHIRDRVFIIAYANSRRLSQQSQLHTEQPAGIETGTQRDDSERLRDHLADSIGKGLEIRQGENTGGARSIDWSIVTRSSWWAAEPCVGRVANGISRRVDRLKCLGNAVVPQVAELIGGQVVKLIQRELGGT
jgi:DNA (cytosine-5)-methyltransferase 1